MKPINTYTKVFSIGSNNPAQIAIRVESPLEDILSRMQPARLCNHVRSYAGYSTRWGGAPATISQTDNENDFFEGIAVDMTDRELALMDKFEGYPTNYDRVHSHIILKDTDEKVKTQVYKMNVVDTFTPPSESYLIAIAKTISAYHYLGQCTPGFDYTNIRIDVYDASKGGKFVSTEYVRKSLDEMFPEPEIRMRVERCIHGGEYYY